MKTNWPTKKLGEAIDFLKGKKMPVTEEQRLGYEPYIGIDTLRTRGYKLFTPEKNGIKCSKDDVLVVWDGAYAGTVGIEVSGFAGSTVAKVVIREPKLDSRFLRYFWEFNGTKIRNAAQGAAIPHLSKPFINNLKIPLPPLAIQKQIVERLDKIAEAHKLNDELIKKVDELFQSLLHKELNPVRDSKYSNGVNPAGPADAKSMAGKKDWKEDKFVNCIEKNPLKIKGIPREKYQTSGKFPIIDQSDKFIVGYTNNEDKVYRIDSPVIIFGDHTRIFKYIDFNFAIGADGTQIVIPDRKIFIPKFFYFLMLNLKINNLGYSRHFKILKTKRLTLLPLETQKKIVAKLSAVQDYKKQLLGQKTKLKELFDSSLAKSMKA